MIIAVASRKASPGVTSLTAWLADFWTEPGVTRLIVEADPSGGSLAARWSSAHSLTWDPGLLTLSTSRSVLAADTLEPLTQRLTGGVLVAAAPPAPEQVIGALTRWGDRGAAELAAAEGVRAFVDCGRLTAASPALTLARRAALTVLVCRPRLDEVNALVPAVAELTAAGCTLGLVCVGSEPYLPAEIANAAGLPLLGVLPVDLRAAAVFDRDGLDSGRPFRRSALAQTAAELTEYVRSRAAEILTGSDRVEAARPPAADPPGDDLPAPEPAPRPGAAAAAPDAGPDAGPGALPRSEADPDDGGLRGPGPTLLSNPVGPAADVDLRWPPPRPAVPAGDAAPPPPAPTGRETQPVAADAGPETAVATMPPPPPAASPAEEPYPGAAATSPLPAGLSIPAAPGTVAPESGAPTGPDPAHSAASSPPEPDSALPLPPPPSVLFDAAQSPPPPPPAAGPDGVPVPLPPPPATDLPSLPPPPGAQAIPVSLAIAAARARAQGQAPPDDGITAAWPPPPPPDGADPSTGSGS